MQHNSFKDFTDLLDNLDRDFFRIQCRRDRHEEVNLVVGVFSYELSGDLFSNGEELGARVFVWRDAMKRAVSTWHARVCSSLKGCTAVHPIVRKHANLTC